MAFKGSLQSLSEKGFKTVIDDFFRWRDLDETRRFYKFEHPYMREYTFEQVYDVQLAPGYDYFLLLHTPDSMETLNVRKSWSRLATIAQTIPGIIIGHVDMTGPMVKGEFPAANWHHMPDY
jgi:hypothetical protein